MQFRVPDPDYTSSVRAKASFRLALRLTLYFVAVLWVVFLLSWGLKLNLGYVVIWPREPLGLMGILSAPLLHGSFSHLISNSLPLLVLGTTLLYLYPSAALRVIPFIYLGSGLLVWLLARPAAHFGASGLVYGFAVYIFTAGLLRRDKRAIAASLLVFFLYSSLVTGLLPTVPGISWETHLAAAILGLLSAFVYRHFDVLPQKKYAWEDDINDDEPMG